MSVINQMLKDLARRAKPLPNSDIVISGLVIAKNIQSSKKKVLYGLILGSLILLFITTFLMNNLSNSKKNHVLSVSDFSETQSVNKNNEVSSSDLSGLFFDPVKLTTFTFQKENEMTSLRILLNQSVFYQIRSYKNDQLIVELENTKMETSAPSIDPNSGAIKKMKVLPGVDGNLKVIFKLNPGYELNHLGLNQAGQFSELQIDFSNKNHLDSSNNSYINKDAQTIGIKKLTKDSSITDEYLTAVQLSKQNQTTKSITLLTELLKKSPEFVPARKTLAMLLLKQGRITKSEKIINAGLQLRPFYPSYIQLKAQILVDRGKIKEALNLLQSTTPSLEQNPEYYSFIAALHQRQNQPKLAEKLYEQLIHIQPNNSIWWMGLGIACETLNQNPKALEAYQRANTNRLSPELKVYVETRIHELSNNGENNSNG